MKLETVKRDVMTSGMLEVASATIAPSAKIFDMFANDTYANKPLAIMRETVANGIDAHRAAGCADRPVLVTLPTALDPTCRIRDFGTGMPHAFVMGPFMAYTDGSTKDKDDDAIGGFGIGSKSPLSYVDAFTLRVVHQGVLSVYTLFKNDVGIPNIGLQGQTTTDEHDGVEISFPVEDADQQAFRDAAQEALQYFMPIPVVENGSIDAPSYQYVGTDWAMRHKAGSLGIIMGGVRYPVSTGNLSYDLRQNKRLAPLLEYGLDLTLPIGACGIAMSREALSYVPKTSTNIAAALENVIDDVVETFATFFDKCPNEWAAMELLAKETGLDGYSRTARAQLLLGNAKYNGQKLETSFAPKVADIKAWVVEPKHARRRGGGNVPSPKWASLDDLYAIVPAKIEAVIIDDLPQSPKSKTAARLREYIEQLPQAKQVLVLRGSDERQVTKIVDTLRGCDNYVLTSSMPEPAATARVKTTRPRVRMFRFNGTADCYTHATITNLTPSNSKSNAVSEIAYVDQPTTGIMVVMDSFDLPSDYHKAIQTGLIKHDELVFVNQGDAPKLKATFQNFVTVFTDRLAKKLAAYPELPQRLAISRVSEFDELFRVCRAIEGVGPLTPAQLKRPFGQIMTIWQKYVKPLTDEQKRLAPFVSVALPKGLDPHKLVETFGKQQPDAKILIEVLSLNNAEHVALLAKNL